MNIFRKKSCSIGAAFLLLSTGASATLSYRCEQQTMQNAIQSPLESYFYILYDAPGAFKKYTILSYSKDKLNSSLEYDNGETKESFYENQRVIVTDWKKFSNQFNLFKKEINESLHADDRDLELASKLNLDFISKVNSPAIYHSLQLTHFDERMKKNGDAVNFQFVKPGTEIELKTNLPGSKVNLKVASTEIFFNEASGMLVQVEVKIKSAFLSYVFVCRSWGADKIPADYLLLNKGKKENGEFDQFKLLEDDLAEAKGQFSTAVYDVMFRSLVNFHMNNSFSDSSDNKIQIIHALMKSEVMKDFFVDLDKNKSASENSKKLKEFKDVIKKQLLIFSRHHLPLEYAKLEPTKLAIIYRDMYEILVSYNELLKKGYK